MSFGSHKSSNSVPKNDLTETSKDKKKMHTKADPTMAISEAQPGKKVPYEEYTQLLITLHQLHKLWISRRWKVSVTSSTVI